MQPAKLPLVKSLSLLRIAGWLFAMVAILLVFIFWPTSDNKTRSPKHRNTPSHTSSHPNAPKRAESAKIAAPLENPVNSTTHRQALPRKCPVTTFSAIGGLLANEQISHDETALEMAEIALDGNRPEAERLEAMEHGKNLGFNHLLPLSSDPNLPLPLAESYLHGLHGHDQAKEQVSGALGLLDHSDPDIRQQAQTLLGFLLEAEDDNESPDKLREKADAFLRQPEEEDEEISGQ